MDKNFEESKFLPLTSGQLPVNYRLYPVNIRLISQQVDFWVSIIGDLIK